MSTASTRIVVRNLSPLPRLHWAVVTVPRDRVRGITDPEWTFLTEDGRRFRAVRGAVRGIKAVFRVRVMIDGGATLRGQLFPRRHAEANPDGSTGPRVHPWVADDLIEMVPVIGASDGNYDDVAWATQPSITIVDVSPAHRRFRIDQRLRAFGLHFSAWVDVLEGDPVAPFVARVTWSDRGDPANMRRIQHLLWRCGEAAAFDFARRLGIQECVPEGRDWVALLNSSPVTFKDGMALAFSGNLLAFVSDGFPTPKDPGDPFDPHNRGVEDLKAGAAGPLLAVCCDWDEAWLAAKHLPRFSNPTVAGNMAAQDWQQFENQQAAYAGWLGDRQFGLSRTPGQTGDQSEFGATKGTSAVVALDPRSIYAMRYSAYGDALRGYTHFEDDGRPLVLALHPQWVTWSRETHFSGGVSPDRLGKNGQLPFPGGMWLGVDDEHCGANYFAAYAALADDPLIDDQVRHLLTTDAAGYRMRFPNNGSGASRAQGRTSGAWAQLASIADDETAGGFTMLLAKRWLQTLSIDTLFGGRPMRTPCVQGPDPRKPIYDLQGQLARYTCVWEIGLFVVGAMQTLNGGALAGDDEARLRAALTAACETLARFGFFKQNGTWYTVADILWNDGYAPPGGMVFPSPHINANAGAGDVLSWTFAGCVGARDFLPTSHPDWEQLNSYVLDLTGGQEAGNRTAAEWWAIARSIVRPPQVGAP